MNSFDMTIIMRLVMAIVAGGILGHERGKKRRAAGFRTHILVCLSACAIMVTNIQMTNSFQLGDPTRMPAQVISGIGFLGAGCILITDKNRIKGLTTAAGLWADACLGLCIGSGCYVVAVFSCIAIYLVLTVFRYMDNILVNRTRYMQLYIEFSSIGDMSGFIKKLKQQGIKIAEMDLVKVKNKEKAEAAAVLSLQFKKAVQSEELMAEWLQCEEVMALEELD